MTEEKVDRLSKPRAIVALIIVLTGLGLALLGSYSLIQAWVWEFPLVLVMFFGAVAFFVVWVIMLFYLSVCICELRGLTPDDVFGEDSKKQS